MRTGLILLLCLIASDIEAKTSAVLDSSSTLIEIRALDRMYITEFRRVEIRDEEGYRYCVYKDYENTFRKIKKLKYTVYAKNGNRIRTFGLHDAVDVMFNAPYEVADTRTLILDPGYRSFPFFVEIETVIAYDEFLDFPEWMPRFSYDLEVKSATLVLQCPTNYRFMSKSFNFSPGDSTMSEVDGVKTYLWKLRDLPAVAQYSNDRVFARDQTRVILSPFAFRMGGLSGTYSTWANFGDWYLALNEGPHVLSERTKRDLQEIRQNSTDEKDLIRNVYRYMQQKTRYVSIQLGIGGFKALPVEKVDKDGYGDCKALTHYMRALLDEVHVASHYVLAKAGQDVPDVISDLPSNQFNHIFLAVPHLTDTTWLECTSQVVPASYLGTFTDDRNVLWITPAKSRIIRTPRYSASESTCKTNSEVRLDRDGNAVITISRTQAGFYFDEMLAYNSMSAAQQEHYNLSKFSYPDFSIQSFKYSVQPEKQLLALDYELKVNALASRAGDRILLPLNIFGSDKTVALDLLNHKAEINRAFTLLDTTEILVPEGFHVAALPEREHAATPYGIIEITVSVGEPGRFVISRKLILNKGSYSGDEFAKFHDFIKTVRGFDRIKIAMTSGT